ncbi:MULTISPECIES: hypothetical protein [unclassified Bradyrhizobium]
MTALVEAWTRLFRLNLLGLILLPQDLFPNLKAASASVVDMT